jgi:hypothetical protein
MRALALVDSDSYVKWGAALLGQLPDSWRRELALVTTPAAPSAAQLAAALEGSGVDAAQVSSLTLDALRQRVRDHLPDVVIVAMRGPAASVVLRMLASLERRPVLVSGLPGISIPATSKALLFRGQADLMVLHSKRELREFAVLAGVKDWDYRFALATLPFVDRRPVAGGRDIVFAVQAIVPATLEERERMLDLLIETAGRNPGHRVVVKVRAVSGESQTHAETNSYPDLLAARSAVPVNLVVASGPMSDALDSAAALVTVSSTAAIEAIGRGVPVLAVDEFGVSARLINLVFEGSGLFGGAADLVALRFAHPRPEWLDDNYFHDDADSDWTRVLDELLAARAAGTLEPRRSLRGRAGGALRLAWERKRAFGDEDTSRAGAVALVVGLPVRRVALTAQRLRRATVK